MQSGILLIDKPSGKTSHDIVALLRKKLNIKEVGHCGTLDPIATGLLVMLIGDATKISEHLITDDKSYDVEALMGFRTDTWDRDGSFIDEDGNFIDKEEKASWLKKDNSISLNDTDFVKVSQKLLGDVQLKVPSYSAVKVDGKKLYEYARKQQVVPALLREMHFFKAELSKINSNKIHFTLCCKKGSYVRSWVYHLGEEIGCGGIVNELRRIKSGEFSIDQSISLDEFLQIDNPMEEFAEGVAGKLAEKRRAFIPLKQCLSKLKSFSLSGRDEQLMRNGQMPNDLKKRLVFDQKQVNNKDESECIRIFSGSSGELLSLIELRPKDHPKIKKVFN